MRVVHRSHFENTCIVGQESLPCESKLKEGLKDERDLPFYLVAGRRAVQADKRRKKCFRDGTKGTQNDGPRSSGGPKPNGFRE